MSLIICKECGKEISDKSKKCPNCGFMDKKERKLPSKRTLMIIGIVIIISIFGIGVYSYIKYEKRIQAEIEANTLNEDETIVAKIVKNYRAALKNPSSMEIFEIRKYDKFVLMDTSGQNGFGGTTRDIVAYNLDGGYMGNDNKADRTITKYTSSEDKLEIVLAQAIKKNWKERTDYIIIDKNKILRNLEKVN